LIPTGCEFASASVNSFARYAESARSEGSLRFKSISKWDCLKGGLVFCTAECHTLHMWKAL